MGQVVFITGKIRFHRLFCLLVTKLVAIWTGPETLQMENEHIGISVLLKKRGRNTDKCSEG